MHKKYWENGSLCFFSFFLRLQSRLFYWRGLVSSAPVSVSESVSLWLQQHRHTHQHRPVSPPVEWRRELLFFFFFHLLADSEKLIVSCCCFFNSEVWLPDHLSLGFLTNFGQWRSAVPKLFLQTPLLWIVKAPTSWKQTQIFLQIYTGLYFEKLLLIQNCCSHWVSKIKLQTSLCYCNRSVPPTLQTCLLTGATPPFSCKGCYKHSLWPGCFYKSSHTWLSCCWWGCTPPSLLQLLSRLI